MKRMTVVLVGAVLVLAACGSSAKPASAPPPASSSGSTTVPTPKNTTVTFYQAGTYTFQVTITDPAGLNATSSVTISVSQTLTAVSVSPGNATLPNGATEQFSALAMDQFGAAMVSQPSFTWVVLPGGVGSIDGAGMYTAPASGGGNDTISAAAGAMSGTAYVTVASSPGAPTGLTATAASAHQVNLAWTEASSNATGFSIQRTANGGKSWSQIAQVAGSVSSYSDQTVTKGKSYTYRVDAFNSAGTSSWSKLASVTTPLRTPVGTPPSAYPAPDLPEYQHPPHTAALFPPTPAAKALTDQTTGADFPVPYCPMPLNECGQDPQSTSSDSSSASGTAPAPVEVDEFMASMQLLDDLAELLFG